MGFVSRPEDRLFNLESFLHSFPVNLKTGQVRFHFLFFQFVSRNHVLIRRHVTRRRSHSARNWLQGGALCVPAGCTCAILTSESCVGRFFYVSNNSETITTCLQKNSEHYVSLIPLLFPLYRGVIYNLLWTFHLSCSAWQDAEFCDLEAKLLFLPETQVSATSLSLSFHLFVSTPRKSSC